MTNLSKGSEWRRWDLHVHAPGTKLSDNYKGFDDNLEEFVNKIEQSKADVIGITDYFSIDGYENFLNKFREKFPSSRKVFFPNIELRLFEIIGSSETCPHLHIIFDNDKNHCDVSEIRSFLGRLKLYQTGSHREDKFATDLSQKKEFEAATVSRENILDALESTFGNRKPYLLIFPANNDGVKSTDTSSPRKVAISDELDKVSDLFFGKASNRNYFLKTTRYEDEGSIPKPVVSGSDAHSFEDLERINMPHKNFEFTWIKADTTFEGLKQILYEPEERVWIGLNPPDHREPHRIIAKLRTQKRPGWLDWPDKIRLNPGLVCIIGNKGSGKTGLLDVIARAACSIDSNSEGSFISKASKDLSKNGTEASIGWLSNDNGQTVLLSEPSGLDDRKVTYLTQQFVEKLCAVHEGDKLSLEIKKVIYQKIPEEDRLGCSSFENLRKMKQANVSQSRQKKINVLNDCIRAWHQLQERIKSLGDKQSRLTRLESDLSQIEIPKIKETDMQAVSNEIERLAQLEARMTAEIGEENSRLHEIAEIRQEVEDQYEQHKQFFDEISNTLRSLEFSDEEINKFNINFQGEPLVILNQKEEQLEAIIAAKKGAPEDNNEGTLSGVRKNLSKQHDKFNVDQALKASIEKKLQRRNQIELSINSQKAEIEAIEMERKEENTLKEDMLSAYIEVFETYQQEEKVDENLYAPLKSEIGNGNNSFEVDIVRNIDSSIWSNNLSEVIDRRRGRNLFEKIEDIAPSLAKYWQEKDGELLKDKIRLFLDEAMAIVSAGTGGKFRKGKSQMDFLMTAFDLSHIRVNYSLKYNQLSLASMSPGTKGLALMILYLQLNQDDQRPLLVDQPEENLDNQSIYNDLRKFFREAKKRRQIIMVTHNPNLVVNADADQVIVTHIEPGNSGKVPVLSISSSGAIENPEIRKSICSILEGGTDAFKKRETRYGLE